MKGTRTMTLSSEPTLSSFLDEDPAVIEAMGYKWSSQTTPRYTLGEEVMVLDRTGYHDSVISIASTTIIVDDDGKRYLAIDTRGFGIFPEELDRSGRIKGARKHK
jgi:hypothetical protein